MALRAPSWEYPGRFFCLALLRQTTVQIIQYPFLIRRPQRRHQVTFGTVAGDPVYHHMRWYLRQAGFQPSRIFFQLHHHRFRRRRIIDFKIDLKRCICFCRCTFLFFRRGGYHPPAKIAERQSYTENRRRLERWRLGIESTIFKLCILSP